MVFRIHDAIGTCSSGNVAKNCCSLRSRDRERLSQGRSTAKGVVRREPHVLYCRFFFSRKFETSFFGKMREIFKVNRVQHPPTFRRNKKGRSDDRCLKLVASFKHDLQPSNCTKKVSKNYSFPGSKPNGFQRMRYMAK